MNGAIRVMIAAAGLMLMGGCNRSSGPRYTLMPAMVGGQEWVRLDSETGDMLVCGRRAPLAAPEPPPPPPYIAQNAIMCDPVTIGKVVN